MNNYTIINSGDLESFKDSYVGDVSNQRLSNDKKLYVVRLKENCIIDNYTTYTHKEILVELSTENWISNDLIP